MDIRKFFGKKPAAGDAGTGAAAGGAADKPKASAEDDKKKASSSKGTDKKVAASPAAKTASKKSTAASAGEHVHFGCLVYGNRCQRSNVSSHRHQGCALIRIQEPQEVGQR
jgi:hypothetical protein